MSHAAEAWFLHPATPDEPKGRLARLHRAAFELPDPAEDELLVEPLYGSWEGNMNHALTRSPIDICRQRNESRVVLGNSGVVRVLRPGSGVTGFREGDVAMLFNSGVADRWGYMVLAGSYDAPGTSGCLATRMIVKERMLLPLPESSRYSLPQWAVFSLRYVTAWANWRMAWGTFRLQVDAQQLPSPHVWGWGGGTTLAELQLARHHGCQTVMVSGDPGRLGQVEVGGVAALDRRRFPDLVSDPQADEAGRARQKASEEAFLAEVRERTEGLGVQIFVDYIGTPLLRTTLKALGRASVLTTAGWQQGMEIKLLRAVECIQRHQHIHTHFARYDEAADAMAFGESQGWMPQVDEQMWSFDEIPDLAAAFHRREVGLFPVFSINPE